MLYKRIRDSRLMVTTASRRVLCCKVLINMNSKLTDIHTMSFITRYQRLCQHLRKIKTMDICLISIKNQKQCVPAKAELRYESGTGDRELKALEVRITT